MKGEIYELLSKQYKNAQEVMTEIINLQAILNLPKGTEHFLSDLHGESKVFSRLLKTASGVIRTKIDLTFGDRLAAVDKNALAAMIYEPKEELQKLRKQKKGQVKKQYRALLLRLIEVCKQVSAKYTRSKVRKALPYQYRYIIDELINMPDHSIDKSDYYNNIIDGIVELGNAERFIQALCEVISRLAIDHLHILGDIYDRGNGSAEIMDTLQKYHSLDIAWGNHDILWMGAHFGNRACVCNVLRINCAYRNLVALESGYAINLRPLVTFALEEYGEDVGEDFPISDVFGTESEFEKNDLLSKMAKAITVIQLKLENQLIKAHPEFDMQDRILYPSDTLTEKEEALINLLTEEFVHNKRLAEHVRFLLSKGAMYQVANGNLLLHGCVPTEENGEFSRVAVGNKTYAGKDLYDRLEKLVRAAAEGDAYAVDYIWYLWCGKKSPLYGRDKMCVYTRYFEHRAEVENKDPYYDHVKQEEFCLKVLKNFGLSGKYSTIVNGHVPVKVKDGERPESGNVRHVTIDGGLSRAYHKKTGIGGYTLINNSQGLYLVSHLPEEDVSSFGMQSEIRTLKVYDKRILVKETDIGRAIQKQINVLKGMLTEYYKA